MSRLFTFGCSYTSYAWPTWAELYSVQHDQFYNYGCIGVGNKAIFERLMQAISKHNISKDDVVVVQWTHHTRFDWYLNSDRLNRGIGWQTRGSMFIDENKRIFDSRFLNIFFDEESYYMHTLNFMQAAALTLDSIGCRWKFTSITDISKTTSKNNLFEKTTILKYANSKHVDTTTDGLWDIYPKLKHYEQSVFMKFSDHWLPPIKDWITEHVNEITHYKFLNIGPTLIDYHPTAEQYSKYIFANLEISNDTKLKILEYVEKLNKIIITDVLQDRLAVVKQLEQSFPHLAASEIQ